MKAVRETQLQDVRCKNGDLPTDLYDPAVIGPFRSV